MFFARTDMRFNNYQWAVVHGLAWVACLADGWVLHNHVLFGIGLFFLFYSLWRITVATPEDEEFDRILREQASREASGWRKLQIAFLQASAESFDDWEHSHRPEQYSVERRAYLAGFEAGRRYEKLKDAND